MPCLPENLQRFLRCNCTNLYYLSIPMEPVEWTLACLLYLGSISAPNTYDGCTITSLEQAHHPQIVMIESSPTMSAFVWSEYSDDVETIEFVHDECW